MGGSAASRSGSAARGEAPVFCIADIEGFQEDAPPREVRWLGCQIRESAGPHWPPARLCTLTPAEDAKAFQAIMLMFVLDACEGLDDLPKIAAAHEQRSFWGGCAAAAPVGAVEHHHPALQLSRDPDRKVAWEGSRKLPRVPTAEVGCRRRQALDVVERLPIPHQPLVLPRNVAVERVLPLDGLFPSDQVEPQRAHELARVLAEVDAAAAVHPREDDLEDAVPRRILGDHPLPLRLREEVQEVRVEALRRAALPRLGEARHRAEEAAQVQAREARARDRRDDHLAVLAGDRRGLGDGGFNRHDLRGDGLFSGCAAR